MKLNFNLRVLQKGVKPSEQKETPINIVLRWNNQRLVRPSQKTILPHYWDFEKQQANSKLDSYSTFNANLKNHASELFKAYETFQIEHNREPSLSDFKNYLVEKLDKPKKPIVEIKPPTFIELISVKIDSETQRLKAEGKENIIKRSTYSYRRLQELLKDYGMTENVGINYEDISMNWYYNFMEFLNEKNYTPNYQGKIIKGIITILNLANELGYSNNKVHKNKNFKKFQVITFHTYLNNFEIEKLYKCNLDGNEGLINVRDLFVVACRTGLRISDFKRISKDHIITSTIEVEEGKLDREFLRVLTQKSQKEVDIPLHSNVAEILLKYDYDLSRISGKKFNERLKKVCQKAGLDEVCVYNEVKGSVTTRKEQPKYELISSHTGRRSFATNHYKEGFPIISIMAITGHSKVADFMNYIVLDANEHAKVIASHYYKLEEEKRTSKQHLKLA